MFYALQEPEGSLRNSSEIKMYQPIEVLEATSNS